MYTMSNRIQGILRGWRLFGTVHVIGSCVCLLAFASGFANPDISTAYGRTMTIAYVAILAIFLVDALAVSYLAYRARWFIGTGQFKTAFYAGMSWSYLWSLMSGVSDSPNGVRRFARKYANPAERLQLESLLKQSNLGDALALMQGIATRLISRDRAAERKQERAHRRASEVNTLIAEGVALGIPEHELIGESADDCRARIKRKRDDRELLSRAAREGCEAITARLLAEKGYGVAYATLVAGIALRERADRVDIGTGERVRALIASDRVAEAEQCVVQAELAISFARKRVELQRSIDCLPPDRRTIALGKLSALGELEFGTRPFRVAVHQLEELIGSR